MSDIAETDRLVTKVEELQEPWWRRWFGWEARS